jgi:hypothetical protein
MNALYQLQNELVRENIYLKIEPLEIDLLTIDHQSNDKKISDSANAKMQEYYLNWDHYHETTQEDVNELLNNFWKMFNAFDQKDEALEILGLSTDVSWNEIKSRYRVLAARFHPDKGGEASKFIELRQAYEILKGMYI